MRLALLLPGPAAGISGGYAYDARIAAGLRALGHEVRAIDLPGRHPLPDATAQAGARAALDALAPDEVAVIDGLGLPAFAPLADELANRRAVGLIHHPTALETGAPEAERDALRTREQALLPRLARLVTTSRLTAARLSPEFGVDPARVGTVEPGTDPAPRSTGSGAADTEAGGTDAADPHAAPPRPPVAILSVGALIPRKGHDVLLRALGRLTDLDWRLIIAGDPRDPVHAHALQALAEELGIAARIRLAGEVDAAELAALHDAADIFALASWWEGYGMAVAEAMARGLPLALCAGGALAELMPREAGVSVFPGDHAALSRALRRVIFDHALRAAMAEASWQAGQRLPRWDDQAARFAAELDLAAGG